LAKFVEQGMIKQVNIDPNKMRFDVCIDDHDHLYCWICDNVYDIFYDKKNWMEDFYKNNEEGHRIDSVSMNVKGVCKYCEGVSQTMKIKNI
jgi:Fe2+ or Zn2+ uptake regulation protein